MRQRHTKGCERERLDHILDRIAGSLDRLRDCPEDIDAFRDDLQQEMGALRAEVEREKARITRKLKREYERAFPGSTVKLTFDEALSGTVWWQGFAPHTNAERKARLWQAAERALTRKERGQLGRIYGKTYEEADDGDGC